MRKTLRIIVSVVGIGIGCGLVALLVNHVRFPGYSYTLQYTTITPVLNGLYIAAGIGFGALFYFGSPSFFKRIKNTLQHAENWFHNTPAIDILFGVLGLMLGFLLAYLIGLAVQTIRIPVLPEVILILLYIALGYLGCRFGLTKCRDIIGAVKQGAGGNAKAKVLDTSAIIDGRIYDVCRTGFLEGPLVVPTFVLKELRHIADSSDPIKRNKGRRGLDIIQNMRENLNQTVLIDERTYDEIDEVDLKLIRLGTDLGAVLVTNDYNLNKVAAVQQLDVMNINDLANALKPVILPGEEVTISIVKEGKENGQGVGYLDDGTMVIVEGGKNCIGEERNIIVTSALQTSAGRMIFAKICSQA